MQPEVTLAGSGILLGPSARIVQPQPSPGSFRFPHEVTELTIDSKKLKHGYRLVCAGLPGFLGLGELSGFYCSP